LLQPQLPVVFAPQPVEPQELPAVQLPLQEAALPHVHSPPLAAPQELKPQLLSTVHPPLQLPHPATVGISEEFALYALTPNTPAITSTKTRLAIIQYFILTSLFDLIFIKEFRNSSL